MDNNDSYYNVTVDGETFKVHYTDLGTFVQRLVFTFKSITITQVKNETST